MFKAIKNDHLNIANSTERKLKQNGKSRSKRTS